MNELLGTLGITWTVALLVLALAVPAAMAQSRTDGYNPDVPTDVIGDDTTGDDADDTVTPSDTGDPGASGSELAFTGLDLGLVALGGGSLLLLGVGMRRLTRES